MRLVLRLKHMSIRTEDIDVHWVRRFILSHHKRHLQDMGAPEIRAFLAHLALDEHVAAATQMARWPRRAESARSTLSQERARDGISACLCQHPTVE